MIGTARNIDGLSETNLTVSPGASLKFSQASSFRAKSEKAMNLSKSYLNGFHFTEGISLLSSTAPRLRAGVVNITFTGER